MGPADEVFGGGFCELLECGDGEAGYKRGVS